MTATIITRPLFDGREWTFDTLSRTYDAIEEIAVNDLGLDTYPNQLEIISAVGSSRVDLQACKLEYSIVSPK